MEIKDFRKLVNDSPIKDKLNNLKIVLNYPHLDSKFELNGIQFIYKFIYDQVIGWNNIDDIPEYLLHSKRHFEKLKGRIIGFTEYFIEINKNQFDSQWGQLNSEITNPRFQDNYYVFLIDAPETDFLIKINNKNKNYTEGAIDYLTGITTNFNKGTAYFTGVLFAYEFKNQTESEILQRRNNEKISLGHIREKYNNYIGEAEQQLNANLSDAKENLTTHFETVDKLKEEKKRIKKLLK